MKRPIAMKCTKKQFDAVKLKLQEIGEIGLLLDAFDNYKYLTNNYGDNLCDCFDFVSSDSSWSRSHNNNIHEQWNEKIFLEACGIETEKSFSITESQILDTYHFIEYQENADKFRSWFPDAFKVPEAFESEVKELKIGTWYKSDGGGFNSLICVTKVIKEDGFDSIHYFGFTHGEYKVKYIANNAHAKAYIEATEQEVFEALKNEAVKRGFGKKGVYFKDGSLSKTEVSEIEGFDFWNFDKYKGKNEPSKFNISVGKSECVIFRGTTGKWAEIIPTITLQEAEQQLKKKIIV